MMNMNIVKRVKQIDTRDWLIVLYFFNLIVFANGSIISKIGKLVFSVIALVYLFSNKVTFYWKDYYGWLFMYLTFSICSFAWAASKSYAISGISTILLNSICVFLLLQLCSKNNNWNDVVTNCLIIFPVCLLIRYYIQYGSAIFSGIRNISLGIGHNTAGMFSAWGVFFAIKSIFQKRDSILFYLVFLCFDSVLVMLSMSRKAVLYVIIPISIIFVLSGVSLKKKIRNILVLILLVVISFVLVKNIPILYKYIGSGLEKLISFISKGSGDASAAGRRTRIMFGLDMFKERPLFGWGAMNYNYLFGLHEPMTDMVIADNNFIDVLVNFGVLGFILYYYIFARGIVIYIRNRSNGGLKNIIVFAILITILIFDFGVSSYIYLHSQTFLALAFCALDEDEVIKQLNNQYIVG